MKKIIVLFKTHLDLGFTSFAEDVRRRYIENYIPRAVSIAKELRGEKEGFIWTVGSWILREALEKGNSPETLEEAIEAGDIRWHGLPFTTHTELMDAELFRYGLGISQGLDERFGKKTIAAKMTDVPGHTKAMIPLLCAAGIRFLHIGVNPASTRPDVPTLFRWQTEGGREILVMYNNDYGEMTEIGDSQTAVYFAHTGDNHGPQSAEAIREVYRRLHEAYPEAELCAGTLEDVAKIALSQQNLPVITAEIGDTWIHGTGSDPGKLSSYRSLLRLKERFPECEMQKIYRELLPVPEHTWGLDEKTTLGRWLPDIGVKGEHRYFIRKEFESVRTTENFQRMERSWREQREYVEAAVSVLSGENRELAGEKAAEYKRTKTDINGWKEQKAGCLIETAGFSLSISPSGAVNRLEKDGVFLAEEEHPLGQFLYEVFSAEDYERFRKQYVISDADWALEDFGKIGAERAVSSHERFLPEVRGIFSEENQVVVRMELPQRATELYGGMEELELFIKLKEDEVDFDFAWFGKRANRIPEASWLGFKTEDRIVKIEKMGSLIDPTDVAENGNRTMCAVDRKICLEHTEWETVDAPLFCPENPALLNFTNEKPRMDQGFFLNLHNNVWGTNFCMWYDEDARFRFRLRWKEK